MNFFNYLMFVFLIMAGISLWYKVRYHLNTNNIKKQYRVLSFFNRYFTLTYLLPLTIKQNDTLENNLRKRANLALLIFYLDIIFGLLVSLFTK